MATWREGPVDRRKEHITLIYVADEKPVALVAPGLEQIFHVQYVGMDRFKEKTRDKVLAEVRKDLDFYFVKLNKSDPWWYAKYHCNTTSNVYASVNGPLYWVLYPDTKK